MSGGIDAYDAWLDGQGQVLEDDGGPLQEPLVALNLSAAVTVDPTATLREAMDRMRDRRVGCVVVMSGSELVGIFTERDVLMRLAGLEVDLDDPVADYMTHRPECVPDGTRIVTALAMMLEGGFRHVPVLSGSHVVGVFSMRDAMRIVADEHEDALLTAPPAGQSYGAVREGA